MSPVSAQGPFLSELKTRGLLKQTTAEVTEPNFKDRPVLYVGYDPTAASLHAGSLIPLVTMDRFRRRGGQLIVLLGGATGLIGDPSGKDRERTLESRDVIKERSEKLRAQVSQFFDRTDGPTPIFVDNSDWYREMDVIGFLRDVGKHFSVSQMLARDSVRQRIENREQGISYTEFSYQILQAYDFLHLFRAHDCRWQMGASDQWGNIVSGADLVRRCTEEVVHGITLPLLTNSEGKKYGKSEKGAVWLDPSLTSPYEFYQFWFNTADLDAPRFLTWLTDFEAEEIAGFQRHDTSERVPQRELSFALTARVHGRAQALLAQQASEVIFSGRFDKLSPHVVDLLSHVVPTYVSRGEDVCTIAAVLLAVGASKSKNDVRRLVEQQSILVNGRPVTSLVQDLRELDRSSPALVLTVGKNRRFLLLFEVSGAAPR